MKSLLRKLINFFTSIKSPWLDLYGDLPKTLDYPDCTMFELIEQTALKYPKYTAYSYYGTSVTYEEFIKKIISAAKGLKSIGIKENDRVTICMPNTPEAIITFYAVNVIGAVANMIHPLSGEKEIEFYLNKAKSKYILTIDFTAPKVMNIIEHTKLKKVIISSISENMKFTPKFIYWWKDGRKIKKTKKDNITITWNQMIKQGHKYEGIYKATKTGKDLAVILYSGGTTGFPKGIMLSNHNFNASAMQCHTMCDPSKAGDSILAIMPIFHGFGLGTCIHTVFHTGMKCILVPRFSPQTFADLINQYQPNFLVGVPTLYEALIQNKKLKKGDLACITTVVCGGDAITPELRKRVNNFLIEHGSYAKLRVGYGLTESVSASCLSPRNYYKEGSIGIPFPDTSYKIVKIGTTKKLGYNQDGEICISGPTVMMGYLDEEEETKATLVEHDDGKIWLHTGDVGLMDEDGVIFFKSRIKRIIISSGYNVYPQYIERVINEHEAVATSIVIGVDHPYKVQVAKAYIVLKEGIELNNKIKKEIIEHCKKNLAKYSLPYEYEYRTSLPKTFVGKVAFTKLEDEEKNKKKHKK